MFCYRTLKFDEFFEQKGHEIIIYLLSKKYDYLIFEILETIYVICRCTDLYPDELLQTIEKICDIADLKYDDKKELIIKIKIAAYFSYNSKSYQYFKKSSVYKLIQFLMVKPFPLHIN
jgi:hypothetical protein